MTVLIVDDVGYSRYYHSRIVEKIGFVAQAVESGAQALELLELDSSIDVVLTDLMMREMDGIELFRRSRQITRHGKMGSVPPPAFILMTAMRPGSHSLQYKEVDKIRLAKSLGFANVLFKPLDAAALKQTLEALKRSAECAEVLPGEPALAEG